MTYRTAYLDELVEDPHNARLHDLANLTAIRASLLRFGQVEPLVVRSGTQQVVGGNGRLQVMRALGWETAEIREVDLSDDEAIALGLALNRTAELATWDETMLRTHLKTLSDADFDIGGFALNEEDLRFDAGIENTVKGKDEKKFDPNDKTYTKKITPPVYEIRGDKPEVSDLFSKEKTDSLVRSIKKAKLPPDVSSFLVAAAERHTVFNFAKIAEFYAHADAEIQALMEDSGLVIVDFDKAIECGFVNLTEKLAQIAGIEEGQEDA